MLSVLFAFVHNQFDFTLEQKFTNEIWIIAFSEGVNKKIEWQKEKKYDISLTILSNA